MSIFIFSLIILAVVASNLVIWGIPFVFQKSTHICGHLMSWIYRYCIITCMLTLFMFILYFIYDDVHIHDLIVENSPKTDSIPFTCVIFICSFLPVTCLFIADKYKHNNFGNVYFWFKFFDMIVFMILLYYQII
jgi:hypothetical protein